jgi:hypothetical protein
MLFLLNRVGSFARKSLIFIFFCRVSPYSPPTIPAISENRHCPYFPILYIRGHKTAAFRPQMERGRSVFRSKRPRSSDQGASFFGMNPAELSILFFDTYFPFAIL